MGKWFWVGCLAFHGFTIASAFGHGFYCRSTDGHYVTVEQEYRNRRWVPKAFAVGHQNRGTLLKAAARSIYSGRGPRAYSVYAVLGNGAVGASIVELQVGDYEGRNHLFPGESTTANLIFHGGNRRPVRMACFFHDHHE